MKLRRERLSRQPGGRSGDSYSLYVSCCLLAADADMMVAACLPEAVFCRLRLLLQGAGLVAHTAVARTLLRLSLQSVLQHIPL